MLPLITGDVSGRRIFLATAIRAIAVLFVTGGFPGCAKEGRYQSTEPGAAASNGDPNRRAYEAALTVDLIVEEGVYEYEPSVGRFVRVGTLGKWRCGPASSPGELLQWNC